MPITANNDSQDFDPVDFIYNDALTLEAEVISDFLTCTDFSEIFEHPEIDKYTTSIKQENEEGDSETIEVIPGDVALQLVDEDDLTQMFLQYVDALPEETLEDVAKKTAISNLLDEKFKKGTFKKVHKVKGGKQLVNKMIGAMLAKKAIKRNGSKYAKGKAYGSGTGSEKKKIAKNYKKNQAKFGKKQAKRKAYKTLKSLKASEHSDVNLFTEVSVAGQGYGVEVGGEHYEFVASRNYFIEGILPSKMTLPKGKMHETQLTTPMHRGAGLAGSISKLMEREL
jgi:hypothetical protein